MNGEFFCNGCGRLKSVDVGFMTPLAMPTLLGEPGPMQRMMGMVSQGVPGVSMRPFILCDNCLPEGVAGVRVVELGSE